MTEEEKLVHVIGSWVNGRRQYANKESLRLKNIELGANKCSEALHNGHENRNSGTISA